MLRALLLLACTAKVSAFATLPAGEQAGAGDPACADLEPEAIQAEYAEAFGEAVEAGELPEGTTMASCADVAASGGCAEEEVAPSCCATCALPQREARSFWKKLKSWWGRVTSKKKPPPPSPSPPPPSPSPPPPHPSPSPPPPSPSPPPHPSPPPYVFTSAAELKQAVNAWVTHIPLYGPNGGITNVAAAANTKYGAISSWDTSLVDDMGGLFDGKTSFNDDIRAWDTSKVRNMGRMFFRAEWFRLPLPWDTSSVTNMNEMFTRTEKFNKPLALLR